MNVPTCYRCPNRSTVNPETFARELACDLLKSKLKAVRGAGLSVIKFPCPVRPVLFSPGDVVSFSLPVAYGPEGCERATQMQGVVMRTIGRKVLIYCGHEDCNQKVFKLYPDKLKKTEITVAVCAHCSLPIGVERPTMSEDRKWSCRAGYTEDVPIELPCEPAC